MAQARGGEVGAALRELLMEAHSFYALHYTPGGDLQQILLSKCRFLRTISAETPSYLFDSEAEPCYSLRIARFSLKAG